MTAVPKRVLIVDDEENVCDVVRRLLERDQIEVLEATSAPGAMEIIDREALDCVITDIRMPTGSGIDVLDHAKATDAQLPVILLTAQASLQSAVDAVNKGAFHFLHKPFRSEQLRTIVGNAIEIRRARKENAFLKRELRKKSPDRRIIGKSPEIQQVLRLAEKVAGSDCTVLITGESGTGKELFARFIHVRSRRDDRPFVSVNCGALPENLLESELFGHMKGSFTSAHRNKDGLFQVAHGGTLFLDEIGETTPAIQVKLLRALQEREVLPVGGTQPTPVDVRVLAATNSELEERVASNRFRADLFYRLNVVPLAIPPLRQRLDDIPLLTERFLRKACESEGIPVKRIEKATSDLLKQYSWPGNVRELENIVERAVILVDEETITSDALPAVVRGGASLRSGESLMSGQPSLEELERRYIMKVLDGTGWRKKRASQVLRIDTSTLYRKIQRYRLGKDPSEHSTSICAP